VLHAKRKIIDAEDKIGDEVFLKVWFYLNGKCGKLIFPAYDHDRSLILSAAQHFPMRTLKKIASC
jgi:hypothetical protein